MPDNPLPTTNERMAHAAPGELPERLYTTHVLFDATPVSTAAPTNGPARVRFNLRNWQRTLAPHIYEVTLELTVTCTSNSRSIYRVEIHQAGVFDLAAIDPDAQSRALNTVCPRALFAPAQQAADGLVRAGGFPPFELPPVDFDAVYSRDRHAHAVAPQLVALQAFWRAVAHLRAQGRMTPRPTDFHPIHGEALVVAQLSRDALPAADAVLATTPQDKTTLDVMAAVYSMNGVHQRTVEVYRLAVATRPRDARARYNLAAALVFNGDMQAAEREIVESIRLQPMFWDAYTMRSQVRRQTAQTNHIVDLTRLLARFASQPQAVERLNMALAKECEDLGEYSRAFAHLEAGNRIGKLRRHYDFRQDDAIFEALQQHTPTKQQDASGYSTREPIFVFGMPRSGTTLVDRIISSHPDVASAGELKQFGMLLKYACRSPTENVIDADTLARAQLLDWHALGQQYLEATRPLMGKTPHFVDKFPHNFLYAGQIANALPEAKLICVRRNPLDTCLGNFRQVFSETSPFHGYACDLLDAGHYYVRFDQLMAHWQQLFPDRILEIHYEALVADQEAVTRQLLEFCDLRWEPACLTFEKNDAPVATASAAQVRSPLYHDAVERWKRYAQQLAPLRELLTDAGVAGA